MPEFRPGDRVTLSFVGSPTVAFPLDGSISI
jgi:hypothetical protein